jgi:hypothetical protein
MSYEMVPSDEAGDAIFRLPIEESAAKKIFAQMHEILDYHAILENVIVQARDLPPGKDTVARLYRIRFGEDENAAQQERGGVCLFPTDDPLSSHRVEVDVYRTQGTIPMPENRFTDSQMDVVIGLLNDLEMERDLGELPNLSPDCSHLMKPEVGVPDPDFFLE